MPKRNYKTESIQLANSDNWRTEQWLFDQLNQEFDFKIDLCADDNNTKRDLYYSLKNDALDIKNQWYASSFANVPYSNAKPFLIKAYEQSRIWVGVPIVILLRVDTSNNWWVDHALLADEIRFFIGRLKFLDENNKAHFTAKWANALLIFNSTIEKPSISWWKYKEGEKPIESYKFYNRGYV
jgi:site-specific DNA-methyltransferase (adenine-specific)